jgi:hypothetical protein
LGHGVPEIVEDLAKDGIIVSPPTVWTFIQGKGPYKRESYIGDSLLRQYGVIDALGFGIGDRILYHFRLDATPYGPPGSAGEDFVKPAVATRV